MLESVSSRSRERENLSHKIRWQGLEEDACGGPLTSSEYVLCSVHPCKGVHTHTHTNTYTCIQHAYKTHRQGLFDTFTNLQSRSALEDRKDNDVSFEQIGSQSPMDYGHTEQNTNGDGIGSRELTAGNTGPDGSSTEVKYQIYSPKICGYNSRYLKANRSTLKQKQGQNGAWESD